ncbi:septin-4-like isoform X3 [Pseudophryne corroboree]|uniref:septin-4-like isoform X3 n=1 Tax=Pseudophryne corroboree TaxID=495146 RepID=UPI0030814DFF
MIRNFICNDSEEEELTGIIRTIPRETNKRAQEQKERLCIDQQQETKDHREQQEEEERFLTESQQGEGFLHRDQQQEKDRLANQHQEEEEERLRREYQVEKLHREQYGEDENLCREQQHQVEERLLRQHQEETLRREQQEEDRLRRERQKDIRLRWEQQEEKVQKEQHGETFWGEQEAESHRRDQQNYHIMQYEENSPTEQEKAFYSDAMLPEAELISIGHVKQDNIEGEYFSNTLPVLPTRWGCPPLVPPPPPSPSRPKSPWGKLDPYDSIEEDREYVGFATLPNQVHRKYVKKGFEFTLMVADCVTQTVDIVKQTVDIQEKGVRLRLTIVDTPGYGDAINNEDCWKLVADYIDQQFEQYFRDESGLNRKNLQDTRVHCCLYFLSPLGHGMRPLDIEFLRAVQDKVNIVPILGKADSLTPKELIQKKQRIREELEHFGIQIYQFPECDSDQDEDFKTQDMELKKSIPFAVIGSNTIVEINGKRVRGRLYPWGVVEVENEQHCDFVKLRTMLIRTHMQDLKDVTRETHYENYRAQCIQNLTQRVVRERNRNKLTRESGTDFPIPSVPPSPDHDTLRLIREKDEELRRMQEVLQKMQRQMKDSH